MKNGKEVAERLTGGESKSYPWSVILDEEELPLASSDGPEGNIGCPLTPEQFEHFVSMFDMTRSRVTDEELETLRQEHRLFAKPILEAQRRFEQKKRTEKK